MNRTKTVLKLVICLTAVYCGIAVGFATIQPLNVTRYPDNFVFDATSVLAQPIMEVAFHGKMTHVYDWETIDFAAAPKNIPAITVSTNTNKRDLKNGSMFSHVLAELDGDMQAAIIKPAQPIDSKWTLMFCTLDEEPLCQRGRLYTTGEMKILTDGAGLIWGYTETGEYITVQIQEYTTAKEKKHIPYL